MATNLLKKVNRALADRMSDFESGLEYVRATGRVMGVVISSDFTPGADHAKRQRLLRRALADSLSVEELDRVGPIVTMTPNEARLQHEIGSAE